ncbi:MAG: DUF3800 domain-containing protein [Thermoguttaceae bacterium]
MTNEYNIYCDESCHLQRPDEKVMVLGAIIVPSKSVPKISRQLREIKIKHKLLSHAELQKDRSKQFESKWTKVSPGKEDFYLDWINYFFDTQELGFRAVVIDKSQINHEIIPGQTHDTWYYKMFFNAIEPLIDPENRYAIYLDIKDTRSEFKRRELEKVLRNSQRDYDRSIIKRVQHIRSHESEILQLADLLIGAICYKQRRMKELEKEQPSKTKLKIIELIRRRSGKTLERTTLLRERKLNLFFWQPQENVR